MKTNFRKSIVLCVFAVLFTGTIAKGQSISCNYVVHNNMNCVITGVNVQFFDINGPCNSYTNSTLSLGSNPFTCGCTDPVTDVQITVGSGPTVSVADVGLLVAISPQCSSSTTDAAWN